MPKPADVKEVMDYALNNYRIDSHKVYLSGLSMEGSATWECTAEYGKSLAAIVPICGVSWADSAAARRISASAVPVWAFHNRDDSVVTVSS